MRAALITEPGGPEVFQLEEIPDPEFGPDDVLVAVHELLRNLESGLLTSGYVSDSWP